MRLDKAWDPTLVGEGNETFFIRVWKLLPSRRVLKTLSGSSKGKAQRRQYLLVVNLGCYITSRSLMLKELLTCVDCNRTLDSCPETGMNMNKLNLRDLHQSTEWVSRINFFMNQIETIDLFQSGRPSGGRLFLKTRYKNFLWTNKNLWEDFYRSMCSS